MLLRLDPVAIIDLTKTVERPRSPVRVPEPGRWRRGFIGLICQRCDGRIIVVASDHGGTPKALHCVRTDSPWRCFPLSGTCSPHGLMGKLVIHTFLALQSSPLAAEMALASCRSTRKGHPGLETAPG